MFTRWYYRYKAWRMRARHAAIEDAWQHHKRVTNMQNVTHGDRANFVATIRRER